MEYGGCLSIELNDNAELFAQYDNAKIARYNCGRNAIAAVALSIKPKKVWIPYYNCFVIRDTLLKYGINVEMYNIDENYNPIIDEVKQDEWVVYVNYFGIISDKQLNDIVSRFERVIFDNTQALFAKPLFHDNCFNVYSPRKFVGVADGAYVVWDNSYEISEDYPIDVSWERAGFLFKCAELGSNAAYSDCQQGKISFDDGIKQMSKLTRMMLGAIDYNRVEQIRTRNYQILHSKLSKINILSPPFDADAPFVYPLLIEKEGLRSALVKNHIYVSQWWLYLLQEVPQDSVEARLTNYLLPIPLDQRCSAEDIEKLAEIILEQVK